jgi:glycine cleavage system H protein
MAYPAGYKYTKEHEWIDLAGERGKIGITDYSSNSAMSCTSSCPRSAPG